MPSKALIIEDDQDTASLYGHILEFMGFETKIIKSGEQALIWLRGSVPDIVLLDMRLSHNISGLNILDFINGEERLKTSAVIVITGHPNMAEAIENKVDMVLIKPISAKQLSTIVLRLCPNHTSENFLYNASHDPLTGLMNYVRFKDRVEHAVRRSKRVEGLTFAIVFLRVGNLTHLKKYQGQHGLNQVLVDFVDRLQEQVREVDTFSRLREEKFAILLENVKDLANIPMITARIRAVLETPFHIGNQPVSVDVDTWSIHENLIEQLDVYLQSPD